MKLVQTPQPFVVHNADRSIGPHRDEVAKSFDFSVTSHLGAKKPTGKASGFWRKTINKQSIRWGAQDRNVFPGGKNMRNRFMASLLAMSAALAGTAVLAEENAAMNSAINDPSVIQQRVTGT